MKPYFERAGIVILHGDCREILPQLTEQVDLVLTDPPYEAEAHTRGRRVGDGHGVVERPLPFPAITEEVRLASAREMARLARRWVLTFCQIEAAPLWREAFEECGLTYKRTCLWIKPDGAPQFTGDRPGMGYETFVAMHAPGRSRWNGGGRHGVWKYPVGHNHQHMTQKPIALIRDLVAHFSDPGDLILDPFMGSGTTLRAAYDLGRRAIGVELEEKYCEIAARRLSQLVLPLGAG